MSAALPDKLRLVLDYVPCEACLEIPVDDQELHCSLCRRLTRVVAVRTVSEVAVVVERPAPPAAPPVLVPPAPLPLTAEAEEPVDATGLAEPAEPAPAEVEEPFAAVAEEEPPAAVAAAEADEDETDVAFGTTPDDLDVGFGSTPEEPMWSEVEPEEPLAAEAEEGPEGPSFTFDPATLDPEDELVADAEAWAETTLEEDEVELVPVRPEEALRAPMPEPEPWDEPAVEDAWPDEPAELEVLEVVEEEPWAEPTEETRAFAAPAEAEYEVLEVLEEDEPPAPAPPTEEVWEDDAWPEEVSAGAPPEGEPWPEGDLDAEAPEGLPRLEHADDDTLVEERFREEAPAPEEEPEDHSRWARPAPAPAAPPPAPLPADEPAPAAPEAPEPRAEELPVPAPEEPLSALDVPEHHAERLAGVGIRTIADLAKRDVEAVARLTGLPERTVGPWVAGAAFAALGIPLAYARALYDAGYESPRLVRAARAERVAADVNRKLGADGPPPVDAATVRGWLGG